ncbi:hypothetical protein CHS0354_040193 [Potamilus streckersoni]|uniref:Malate dehydrogenase n=1 Tax=Potamilus streckersoni TaxID=2493646 RepID=A0AAE0SGS7_9BIVA|nr:hypothetical protein CHS0354_040193 [Potamilus streckersoni]
MQQHAVGSQIKTVYLNKVLSQPNKLYMAQQGNILVAKEEVHSFIVRCIVGAGAELSHAECLADNLVLADCRGHTTHGLLRTALYVKDLKSDITKGSGVPTILKETPAIALVDGNNLLGPVVGRFCMAMAIRKAQKTGIGFVTARGSNHFGIAGAYSVQAMKQGLLGISMTNASPALVPTRARKMVFGTNPISVAAPALNGDNFVLDMATSAVSLGKVQVCKMDGEDMPDGWGVDKTGRDTTDPSDVLDDGGLHPLGGREITSGYKGYGLAMMVEILCGILSGANYGPKIRHWTSKEEIANLGHCFIAINTNAFESGFEARMADLIDACRNLETAEPKDKVLIPGDRARSKIENVEKSGAIEYSAETIRQAEALARDLGIPMICTMKQL